MHALSTTAAFLPFGEPDKFLGIDRSSASDAFLSLDGADRDAAGSFRGVLDSLLDDQRSFMAATGRVQYDARLDEEGNARQTAERFVAQALVLPMLKQMRESNNAAPPFGPGEGEKKFNALADARLADQIVGSENFPLVDRLTDSLMRRQTAAAGGAGAPVPPARPPVPAPGMPDAALLAQETLDVRG